MVEAISTFSLLVRLGGQLCAIPLEHVAETLRLLAITPLPSAPPGVMGVSIVRGSPVPIVDGRTFVGDGGPLTRLVILCAGSRNVGLAVESIAGLRAIPEAAARSLPPLLGESSIAARLGALDDELLVVLDAARLVPDTLAAMPDSWATAS